MDPVVEVGMVVSHDAMTLTTGLPTVVEAAVTATGQEVSQEATVSR